jgi:DNA-binding HxlR family transcriptional regulator
MKKCYNWEDISFIISGKHRKQILELLEKPKTPTMLKEETKLHFNSVSRTLRELEKNKLIQCLNPNQKLMRFYQITKKGKNLLLDTKKL